MFAKKITKFPPKHQKQFSLKNMKLSPNHRNPKAEILNNLVTKIFAEELCSFSSTKHN